MSNIAFLFLPLAFSSLPAVLPFVSPSSQVTENKETGSPNLRVFVQEMTILGSYHFAATGQRKEVCAVRARYARKEKPSIEADGSKFESIPVGNEDISISEDDEDDALVLGHERRQMQRDAEILRLIYDEEEVESNGDHDENMSVKSDETDGLNELSELNTNLAASFANKSAKESEFTNACALLHITHDMF